jgi:hypothetical protein
MTLPISPQFPVAKEKKRSRLSRIAATAVALLLLAKLAGWTFFHAPLVTLWNAAVDFRGRHSEFVFDAAVFLAGVVIFAMTIAARRTTRRFAIARQLRLTRWESLVEPKEWPKLEGELRAIVSESLRQSRKSVAGRPFSSESTSPT